ncbi:portal protein [Vibrio owensii]|uniref:portal protein n=1 Tax=Vibrio owensii TaxID=696485 RepID=UPI003CE5AC84
MNVTEETTPAVDDKGFNTVQLKALMSDVDNQPPWRDPAQQDCDYYDGMQLSSDLKELYESRGQPVLINNLIAPTIDAVLGMEVRTRHDLMLVADDDEGDLIKDALQEKFKDSWRMARADRACADAYAGQIKAGIHWVEVVRNDDPFYGGKYNIKPVRRQEMWWDWHAQEADLSDARWLMRKRWIDSDEAISWFPEHAEVIKQSINNWADWADVESYEEKDQGLLSAKQDYDNWDRNTTEWMDSARGRVMLEVIYYKTWRLGEVIDLSNGRTVEFNPQNLVHAVAVGSGRIQKRVARWASVREAWFIGPHRIIDRPSTAPAGYFPIVPFVGYREDKSGAPYGIVRRMISAQDEVNFRRMKLTWLLQAKRVIADKDATNMSRDDLMAEVERPDGYIELNPDRRNKKTIAETIRVEQDFNIAAQQFNVMKDSMDQIQSVAGVYNALMGQDSSANSGIAINSLIEQGATTLAEINDNYNYSRTRVADLLMAYLIEDLAKQSNIAVTVHKEDTHKKKQVMLNVSNDDGTVTNDVKRWKGHITQAPTASTPTYRAQMAQQLMEAISKLPQEVQMVTVDMVIELMDIPNKQEFLDRIRSTLNIPKPQEDMTEEELQAAQAQQQKAEELEQMEMKERMANVELIVKRGEELQAKVDKVYADIESKGVADDKTKADTAKVITEMEQVTKEAAAAKAAVLESIETALSAI